MRWVRSACFTILRIPGAETFSNRAAPLTVPVIMTARITSIWRSVIIFSPAVYLILVALAMSNFKIGAPATADSEEAAPQFLDDAAPRNGMMPPPDSEMIAPPITE